MLNRRDAPLPRGRSPGAASIVGPHGIAVLLAASAFLFYDLFSDGDGAVTEEPRPHGMTAECIVLEGFLESPDLRAGFQGTPDEMQRWEDAYSRDCR